MGASQVDVGVEDRPPVCAAITSMRPGPLDRMMTYYGPDRDGFHLPFNFHLTDTAWQPHALASLVEEYEALLSKGSWPTWVLGNHDRPRIASRIGESQARVAAVLLLTLRGIPTIYYGKELGLVDVEIPSDRIQDPVAHSIGVGAGRDPAGPPIAWADGPGFGFTTGESRGSPSTIGRNLPSERRPVPLLGPTLLSSADHDTDGSATLLEPDEARIGVEAVTW